jgi:hypothetical protein
MLLPYHVRRCTTPVSTQIIHKDFDLFEYLPVHSAETYSVSSVSVFSVVTNRDLGAKLLRISLRRSMTIGMWQKRKKLICSAGHTVAQLVSPLNDEFNPICHLLALLGARHILHVSRIRVKALCYNPEGRLFEIFHCFNPSGRTITFGSAQPLTEMSTREYLLGVQAVTFMCRLSRNSGSLNLLEPERPVQALVRDNFVYVLLFGQEELSLSHSLCLSLSLSNTHTRKVNT